MKCLFYTTILSGVLAGIGCSSAVDPLGDADGAVPSAGHADAAKQRDARAGDGNHEALDGALHPKNGDGSLADGSMPAEANAPGDSATGRSDASALADGASAGSDASAPADSANAGPDASTPADSASGGLDAGDPECTSGCTSSPPSVCRDANTLETFGSSIGCIDGLCRFAIGEIACPHGCAAGACAPAVGCTAGSLRCDGVEVETCNSTGSAWLVQQICPGTCTTGLCDAPCTPGAARCDGSIPQTCSSDGSAWVNGTACANACQEGACLQTELVVDGTVVVLDGLQSFTQSVVVKNGGTIQVGQSGSLTVSAPMIDVGPGSFITGTPNGTTCASKWAPDDVSQGIRLVGSTVTVDGNVTWSGNTCPTEGIVVRGGTLAGNGGVSVSSTGRALLLYGAGGLASTLAAPGATKSLMPPNVIASAPYPAGGTYNDDGPPASFTWDKPFSTVSGYYYVIGGTSSVPTAASTLVSGEALASGAPVPPVTYIDVVTLNASGVLGTVPHELVISVNTAPPALASTTHPAPGTYVVNTDAIVSWMGGNAPGGYLSLLDRFPTTRPDPSNGTLEAANLSPAQVLIQNLTAGQQWFHLVGQGPLGYRTKAASHWELDVGSTPTSASEGTIAGTVVDATNAPILGATVTLQRGVAVQTTGAGGVYTFHATVPAGTYEVVATALGMQSAALTLAVTAGTTTDGNFELSTGTGCPTCIDDCAAAACTKAIPCANGLSNPWAGTCDQGVCVSTSVDDLACRAPDGTACNANAECSSGYCSESNVCYEAMSGSACTMGSQCAQGYCTDGKCSNGANGLACGGNAECASNACVYYASGYACAPGGCAAVGTNPCEFCCFPNYCEDMSNGYAYCEPGGA